MCTHELKLDSRLCFQTFTENIRDGTAVEDEDASLNWIYDQPYSGVYVMTLTNSYRAVGYPKR